MANDKKRQIDTKLWQKRWFQSLSHEAKYLYLYLLTNPHGSLSGIYEIMDRLIEFDTGLQNVESIFNELTTKNEVYRFNDFVVIARFPNNHNWKTSWQIGVAYLNEIEALPDQLIKFIRETNYVINYPPIASDGYLDEEFLRLRNLSNNKVKDRKPTNQDEDITKNEEVYSYEGVEGEGAGIPDDEIPF